MIISSFVSTITTYLVSALVIAVILFSVFIIGYMFGRKRKEEFTETSKKITRAVLGGQFSEQEAPFLPGFPKDLKASEARFIGKPVDFIIFKGLDEQNISEVVFVEVKSGTSRLSTNEKNLRDAINAKKVSWYEYRVPDGVAKIQTEPVSKETYATTN
jgi:predicted Holliday junction resolvase-like endonuclease